MRLIDADALKDKLQQHHDFYVLVWSGFDKMPIGEKKRVDEITNCIAEIVNAPTIELKQGEWNPYFFTEEGYNDTFNCLLCGDTFIVMQGKEDMNFCPNCGARMKEVSK